METEKTQLNEQGNSNKPLLSAVLSIYNMELHEEIKIAQYLYVRRVPGGWIYIDTDPVDKSNYTFVPYCADFKPKPESELALPI